MNQMLDGNGYGMNVPGLYDPELIAHFARGRREHAAGMSVTLKLTTLLGRYGLQRPHAQHLPVRRHRHPATSIPVGLHDGLPVGLMIVGRHLANPTCLRVTQAYETAVGGFPAPPPGVRPVS